MMCARELDKFRVKFSRDGEICLNLGESLSNRESIPCISQGATESRHAVCKISYFSSMPRLSMRKA